MLSVVWQWHRMADLVVWFADSRRGFMTKRLRAVLGQGWGACPMNRVKRVHGHVVL